METISMSVRERRRLEAMSRVKARSLTLVEAAELLRLSYRQAKRVWARYQGQGDVGVVHRARGRASNRRTPGARREQALEVYRTKYADYGPTLAAECMAKEDQLPVAVSTLGRWLREAGLWQPRRKRRLHRRRRARRTHCGELVQMDGSHHDWFEGRRPVAVLMVIIDDATGAVTARFYENESWKSAVDLFRHYVLRHGLPRGLYVDQHGIYRPDRAPTDAELLEERGPETQFGRAMRELDVELILARSPQAKGRVERMNGTLQDRLVKALRRAEISDLAAANAFLETTFLPELNTRFGVAAAAPEDWHRPLAERVDLARVLSVQEPRVVANDWTIRWRNQVLQLPCESVEHVDRGQQVTVCETPEGVLRVFAGDSEVAWSPILTGPPPKPPQHNGPTGSIQGLKPAVDHPWRGRGRRPDPAQSVGAAELACSASAR